MQVEYLEYLIEVAQCQSINQASKKLHFNQPHLSNIIKQLESYFDAQLFIRKNNGVILTEHGQQVVQWAQKTLSELKDIKDQFSASFDEDSNKYLKFCIPTCTMKRNFFTIISTYMNQHPSIQIKVEEMSVSDILQQILTDPEALGFVFNINDNITPLLTNELIYYPMEDISIVVYAHRSSQFAKTHKTTSLKALTNESLLIFKPSAIVSPIETLASHCGLSQNIYLVNNLHGFHAIFENGNFITLGVCHKNATTLHNDNIVSIPIRDKINCTLGPIITKEALPNPFISDFIDYFFKQYNSTLY